jgi:hypothetical protein
MANASFNKKEIHFTSKLGLSLRSKLVKLYIWSWNLDTSESTSEILEKFWNVVLKVGEDQLDRSCEKWGSITQSQGGKEYLTYNKEEEG